jgi:DNA helicase-2/ATP-dependent DNA helicase PcrA
MLELTREQAAARDLQPNPIAVVLAGAGSGKTRVMAAKIVQDQEQWILPRQQIIVTFTNKAADELRARIEQAGGSTDCRHLGTLHAWALRELRKSSPELAALEVIGDKPYQKIVKGEIARLKYKGTIDSAKQAATAPRTLFGEAKVIGSAILARCLRNGQLHPDLILGLFAGKIDRLELPADLMLYVDEYQDSSPTDEKIYRALIEHHGAKLYLVGDVRQAIYGFRGASPVLLERAWHKATDCHRAQLTINFRSSGRIVEAGNNLADKMKLPEGSAARMIEAEQPSDGGAFVETAKFITAEAEAEEIADWLKSRPAPWGQIAILVRYNLQARLIAGVLRAHRLPVSCSADAQDFTDQMMGDEDIVKLANVGAGQRLDAKGWENELLKAGLPFEVQDRLLPQLLGCGTAEAILDVLRGQFDPDPAAVTVSTIHSAKGLEWPAVWIAGADEKAFPDRDEETKRLLYVAVTRAQSWLRISSASSRQAHTRETNLAPTKLITIQ